MKKLLLVIVVLLSFNQMPFALADEAPLPEIAPMDDPAPPPIDAPAPEEAK